MKTLAQVLAEERKRQDEREEAAVRRMTGLYENLNAEISSRLRVLDSTIADAIANGGIVKPSWLHQQARYRVLQQDVTALVDLYATEGDRAIRDARMAEIRAGRWDAAERVDALTPDVNMLNTGVNHQAVENMAAQLSRESPVHTVLADMAGQYTEAIEQSLISGVANGRGVDAILRDVMQATGGVMSPQRVRTIIRTESMRAYNTALVDQYEAIPEVVEFEWTAARGARTCLACLAEDGKRYRRAEFIPGRHVNCRCTISPVPENEYQSVKDYFARRGTADEWMRSRSPADIRRHFPSDEAFDAFMRGDVNLGDFSGVKFSDTWEAKTVSQLSGKQALGRRQWLNESNAKNKAAEDARQQRSDAAVKNRQALRDDGYFRPSSKDEYIKWFDDMGVEIVGDAPSVTVMKTWTDGFADMIQRGYDLPPRLEFRDFGEDGVVSTGFGGSIIGHASDTTISVNLGSPYWKSPAKMQRTQYAHMDKSSMSPYHNVYHESAHILHRTSPSYSNTESPRLMDLRPTIKRELSTYGATNDAEFVAEMWAAHMGDGRKPVSRELYDFYVELGGPPLP